MPKFTGRNRDLIKIIKPYGLTLMQTKKHTWVIRADDGKRIVSCSTTPSDRNAHKNVIRDLVKKGLVPDNLKHKS